jgi:hypothetical protein
MFTGARIVMDSGRGEAIEVKASVYMRREKALRPHSSRVAVVRLDAGLFAGPGPGRFRAPGPGLNVLIVLWLGRYFTTRELSVDQGVEYIMAKQTTVRCLATFQKDWRGCPKNNLHPHVCKKKVSIDKDKAKERGAIEAACGTHQCKHCGVSSD